MNHPEIDRLVSRHRDLSACRPDIEQAFGLLRTACKAGGLVLACGAGGSAGIAGQFVNKLLRGVRRTRPVPREFAEALAAEGGPRGSELARRLQGGFPAFHLGAAASLLAAVTDAQGADLAYAQQLYALARSGDVLLAISSGGQSDVLDNALVVARALGVTTIGLADRDGNALRGLCDCLIRVPRATPPEVEELHLPVCHALCVMLEQEYFS